MTEARNPANRLGVELARVELDHELLRAGLELVDTPGIGSIHTHNTEVARGFLPRVDAALCVLDAGQPLSQGERELFREAAERVPRLLMVINKIDHLDHADREVAVEFIRSALRDLLGDKRGRAVRAQRPPPRRTRSAPGAPAQARRRGAPRAAAALGRPAGPRHRGRDRPGGAV